MKEKEKELLNNISSDVKFIKKTLEGNGHEGLIRCVDRHEKQFNMMEGRNKFIYMAIGGGWLFTVIIYLLK